MTDRSVVFSAVTPTVARLVIRGDGAAYRLRNTGQLHTLEAGGAPVFRLWHPYSPDDAWSVETITTTPPTPGRPPQESITDSFWDWVAGDESSAFWEWMAGKVTGDLEMPLFLPEGSYALALAARPLLRSARVLMGNESVSRPSTALTLCDGAPAHALVFGRHAEPTLNAPLIGVPILNCGRSCSSTRWPPSRTATPTSLCGTTSRRGSSSSGAPPSDGDRESGAEGSEDRGKGPAERASRGPEVPSGAVTAPAKGPAH